jgi:hypothetical protein
MMCAVPRVRRWRSVQYDAESTFKLELKNNGVVRRSSQESDVSRGFPFTLKPGKAAHAATFLTSVLEMVSFDQNCNTKYPYHILVSFTCSAEQMLGQYACRAL